TGLTNVTFGSSVATIGYGAFQGCTNLASLTLPQSVRVIEFRAFSGCTSLASIHIPKAVDNLDPEAFSGCTGLAEITVDPLNQFYSSRDGVLFNREQTLLLKYPSAKTGAYNIPETVLTVYSFYTGAFDYCVYLTSLWIPAGISDIQPPNLVGCSSLVAVSVDPDNAAYSSLDGVLFDKSQTTLMRFPATRTGSYTIPRSVESILSEAFQGCAALTGIAIPGSVTNVGYKAFHGCVALTSVTLPNSVRCVGMGAFGACTSLTNAVVSKNLEYLSQGLFEYCTQLSSIELPEHLIGVGEDVTGVGSNGTFQNCTSLGKIRLPQGVEYLRPHAFSGCSNLTGVYFEGNAPSVDPTAFQGANRCSLY
ncbi:leucine-rich repeat domain-containing protein, partial [bacterium]|nr:leucine-rich repeat domain-containing protein [bacterium]